MTLTFNTQWAVVKTHSPTQTHKVKGKLVQKLSGNKQTENGHNSANEEVKRQAYSAVKAIVWATKQHAMRPTLEHKRLFICQAADVFVFVVWSLEQDALVRTKAETFGPNDRNQWLHNSTEVCSNTQSYLHTRRQDSIWQACPGTKQLRYLRQVLKYIHTHTPV